MSVYELKSENIVRHNLSARVLAITVKVKQYYDVIYISKVCVCVYVVVCFVFCRPSLFYFIYPNIFSRLCL